MSQRNYIDLRLMSKTNKRTSHAIHARCTDESIYLCNENQCRQLFLTNQQKESNRILDTEHPAKKTVLCLTCGTQWIVCILCKKRFNFKHKHRAKQHFENVHKILSVPKRTYKQKSLEINEI